MNLFYKKTFDNKGFTLIEIIAVLIILGIMLAVAVSRMRANDSDLIPQADIVKSHLRFAQLKALADDSTSTTTWGIVFSSTSYTLYNNTTAASISLPGENGNSHSFPSGVVSSTPTVAFDSWGNPGATISVILTQGGASTTINIANTTGYITP
jgi:MSHA pilin protein MshC